MILTTPLIARARAARTGRRAGHAGVGAAAGEQSRHSRRDPLTTSAARDCGRARASARLARRAARGARTTRAYLAQGSFRSALAGAAARRSGAHRLRHVDRPRALHGPRPVSRRAHHAAAAVVARRWPTCADPPPHEQIRPRLYPADAERQRGGRAARDARHRASRFVALAPGQRLGNQALAVLSPSSRQRLADASPHRRRRRRATTPTLRERSRGRAQGASSTRPAGCRCSLRRSSSAGAACSSPTIPRRSISRRRWERRRSPSSARRCRTSASARSPNAQRSPGTTRLPAAPVIGTARSGVRSATGAACAS